jgi:hypothetical protein
MPDDSDRDEITRSFLIVMRSLANLSLEMATCRECLRRLGVTDEDFASMRAEIRRGWDTRAEWKLQGIRDRRELETLLDDLEERGSLPV